ncbi:hypothetical protein HY772_09330 [Candidatus Woesearchaeota archaeon]|nr:hypothetical protein [Candidatus Woesearchaeota archaeon]
MITKSDLNRLLRTSCDHPVWMSNPLSGEPLVRQQVAANVLGLEYMDLHLHNGFAILRAVGYLTPNDPKEFTDWKRVVVFELNCITQIRAYLAASLLQKTYPFPENILKCFTFFEERTSHGVCTFLRLDALQKRVIIRNSVRSLVMWKIGFDPLDDTNGKATQWEKLIANLSTLTLTKDMMFKMRAEMVDKTLAFLNQDVSDIPPLTCCGLNLSAEGQQSKSDHS